MKVRVSVNLDRLATLCSFVASAYCEGVIDDEAYYTMMHTIEVNRGEFVDTLTETFEHDPCGSTLFNDWLAKR